MTEGRQGHPDAQGIMHGTRIEALEATVAYAENLETKPKPRPSTKKTAPPKKRKKKR